VACPLCRRSITILIGTRRRSSSYGSYARGGATLMLKEAGSSTLFVLPGSMVIRSSATYITASTGTRKRFFPIPKKTLRPTSRKHTSCSCQPM
jgi:hypothetical protein